jgi:O-antigen/teichoic acid export membrane protein
MQIIKNYLYNIFYQVFILIVPLVTTPYLARIIGPRGVGINSYTGSIVQYFILFGSIGINLYGNRQIAFVRDDSQKLSDTFWEIFFLRIMTITVSFFAFMIFMLIVNRFKPYYWSQSISIIATAFDISWFFMGIENFSVTVLRNFIIKILAVISIFIFVKSYSDLNIYILILSLASLVGNATLFPSLIRYINAPDFKNMSIARHIKPSLVLFVPQIATQIYLVLNKTMLGLMVSVRDTGFFDQSDKIVKIILAIVTATGTVMLPHVANAFAKQKFAKIHSYLYKSFSFVSAVSIPMSLGLIAISDKFVPLFLTSRFDNVIPIIQIESLVIWLIAWSNVIGTQYLLPTNQSRAYSNSVIIGAIINLIANIPLIFIWGASGTAIATVVSEATVTGYQLFIIRGQIKYHELFKDFYKYLLAGVVMFSLTFLINRNSSCSWFSLIIEIFFGIIVYISLLIILRANIMHEAFILMRKILFKRGDSI